MICFLWSGMRSNCSGASKNYVSLLSSDVCVMNQNMVIFTVWNTNNIAGVLQESKKLLKQLFLSIKIFCLQSSWNLQIGNQALDKCIHEHLYHRWRILKVFCSTHSCRNIYYMMDYNFCSLRLFLFFFSGK